MWFRKIEFITLQFSILFVCWVFFGWKNRLGVVISDFHKKKVKMLVRALLHILKLLQEE